MKDNNFPAADRVDSSDKQQSVKLPFHKPPFHKLPFFKKPPFKRALKVALFRAWAAGAVCFFAAWGRSGSLDAGPAFSLNLIFGLIFFMILADILIVNPVIRMASGG
ncbi:MAG: hypothetical protein FWF29_04920, partial [Treponema sp.]|nr:hypothetical protein [Treponema sp.]